MSGDYACESCAQLLREMSDAEDENRDLRARLAEVEAERDKALNQARHWQEQEGKQRRLRHEEGRWKHRALQAELNASDLPGLRARLAEVEAERDTFKRAYSKAADDGFRHAVARSAAEAKLAAVEALCDRWDADDVHTEYEFVTEVRAVLRGETAPRPAEHTFAIDVADDGDPVIVAAELCDKSWVTEPVQREWDTDTNNGGVHYCFNDAGHEGPCVDAGGTARPEPAEPCCDSDDYAGHICLTCHRQHCHCEGGTPGAQWPGTARPAVYDLRPAEVCADCGHPEDKHPKGLIAARLVYCQGAESSAEWCRCTRYVAGGTARPAAEVTRLSPDRQHDYWPWGAHETCGVAVQDPETRTMRACRRSKDDPIHQTR